ncbi:hypothetical protein HHI31_04830 [Campylobacter fetus subsp. venerealis]|uniref:hypothetical protein n=1 Tax=Campylobacter fetus TaxID=196 RepID=UPI0018E74AA9|nr:hypothetical protein [Campylobacter fetus]QQF52181.1 hypothetical protein HHI31_04830 [Campylobacter fetus subsp. venerealis]
MNKIVFCLFIIISFGLADVYNDIENEVMNMIGKNKLCDNIDNQCKKDDKLCKDDYDKILEYINHKFKVHEDILNKKISIVKKKLIKTNPNSLKFEELTLNKMELEFQKEKLKEQKKLITQNAIDKCGLALVSVALSNFSSVILGVDYSKPPQSYSTSAAFWDGYYNFFMFIFKWSDDIYYFFKDKKEQLNYVEFWDTDVLRQIGMHDGKFSYGYVSAIFKSYVDKIVKNIFVILSIIIFMFIFAFICIKSRNKKVIID